MKLTLRSRRRGFTLVEVVIALVILLIAGIGTVAAIIFSRQSMELNKQRMAALNYARQALEQAESFTYYQGGTVRLVQFNEPVEDDLEAELDVSFYDILSDGTPNWEERIISPQNTPPDNRPVVCKVEVRWTPTGSWGGRDHKVSIFSIVRKGTK